MPWTLERADLAALGRGASLLGGGGGGNPRLMALSAGESADWPVQVHQVAELDPATPCVAVGLGGSTTVFGERLPHPDLFAEAIATIDRWTGAPAEAVCMTEIGGMNALSALPLAHELRLVDADLMGTALPELDQFTLLADDVPDLVVAISAWTRGTVLMTDARPKDVEQVLRAAFQAAGGWAGTVIGGFRVGDLAQHAIAGGLARALELGGAWGAAPMSIGSRIAAIGAERLGVGRVTAIEHDRSDVRIRTVDIAGSDGALVRVITRDDALACMVDGRVAARAPQIIDVVDPQSGAVLQVEDIAVGKSVAVLVLDAPAWWTASPERLAMVLPSRYGLEGLDQVDR
ncbi:DUF917 domain-containing protein [Agrococcus sp. ProA11]|uniref:DUF917 domain-containing protein n=1 Tax=Agrococcus chionoecetis TaxID=3153752 RepID=UPI0032614C11